MKRILKTGCLAFGLWMCWALIRQVDIREVQRSLQLLGGWAPTVLIPYFVVYCIDASAWRACFGRSGLDGIRFLTLLRIRWCGESLNNVVPTAYVGGEALKVLLLKKHGIAPDRAAAAAVISKTVQTLAQLMVLSAAALAFLQRVPSGSPLRHGLLLVMLGSLGVVVGLFWIQKRGIFATLSSLAAQWGLRLQLIDRWRPRGEEMDRTITEFYQNERPQFFKGLLLYCLGWLTDTLEVYWFAWLIGSPISWPQALSVEAFIGLAKILGMFVPGAIGVQESGIVLVGRAVGLSDPLCFSYALIRRAREILFALVGWALFTLEGVSLKSSEAKNT